MNIEPMTREEIDRVTEAQRRLTDAGTMPSPVPTVFRLLATVRSLEEKIVGAPRSKWSIGVEQPVPTVFRTRFVVGVQSFEIARVEIEEDSSEREEDEREAREHCEHVARMFTRAMTLLGLPSPT